MNDAGLVKKMTHDLSNKLMIIEGYISLMQRDKNYITDENLQNIADTLATATDVLIKFKERPDNQNEK
jgi:hypothetical protein